jgi:dissimilatory sulfite reductase (desulfoviridin) alpha/beta subunit
MRWTKDAEEALSKVPFFVRKRVRKRVEEEAARSGSREVTLHHVMTCKKRFLTSMDEEVKGYHVEACFGPTGCPNRAVRDDDLAGRVEEILSSKNIRSFLKDKVKGPLKMHHEFQVTISDCPNGCSRPQIADIGLIGACPPGFSEEPCSGCGACVEACKEGAIVLSDDQERPAIDLNKCLACGQCIAVCPTGTLKEEKCGYRVLVGGKLGRHPQLGRELDGIHSKEETLKIVACCVDFHKSHNVAGERFGEVLNRAGIEALQCALKKDASPQS